MEGRKPAKELPKATFKGKIGKRWKTKKIHTGRKKALAKKRSKFQEGGGKPLTGKEPLGNPHG